MSRLRAAVLIVLLATPAAADVCVPKEVDDGCVDLATGADGENAVVCYVSQCASRMKPTCLAVAPATGAVVRAHATVPEKPPVVAAVNVLRSPALERCGETCAALRKRLVARDELVAAIDPTGKLLFEIEPGYPRRGHTWSLKTGKRITRFAMDELDGPPPPTSFDHVEFVGRHVFVGTPGDDYTLTYDIYTGAIGMMFQHRHVGRGLVVENDGMGRIDLVDYAQAGHPIVATRRIKSRHRDESTLMVQTIVIGDQAVVVTEQPQVTVLVDARKRTVSKPRALPRCSD